jgi:hypothetical protein
VGNTVIVGACGMTTHRDEFLTALGAEEPFPAAHAVAKRLVSEGVDRQALITELEELRRELTHAQEDAALEVMDCLAGFSSPHMRI